MAQPLKVLVVGDGPASRGLAAALERAGLDAQLSGPFGEPADVALRSGAYDCLLVDDHLPGGGALDLLGAMQRTGHRGPPVVVLTDTSDAEHGLRLVARGAQDCVTAGHTSGETLARAIRFAITRHHLQNALDEANARLRELSTLDPLTGLLNRRGIEEVLAGEVARAARHGQPLCAMVVDCDDFKDINDQHGHDAGDEALRAVARSLQQALRHTDRVGRVGGDEFLAVLPDSSIAEVLSAGERICREVRSASVPVRNGSLALTVSVAATVVPRRTGDLGQVLAVTHSALREVKQSGKDRVAWAAASPVATVDAPHGRLEDLLRDASGFCTVCQPIVDLGSGRAIGCEVLSRGPLGIELPDQFFPAAHQLGMLPDLDLGCLGRAVQEAAPLPDGALLHLNVYPVTLAATPPDRLVRLLEPLLGRLDVTLGVSSRWIAGDPSSLRATLGALRSAGLRIGLDHVGFGRSSLEALMVLGPQVIKTDPGLVRGFGRDRSRTQLASRLLNIARSLPADLVAVGLETDEDVAAARELGVPFGQGRALDATPIGGMPPG